MSRIIRFFDSFDEYLGAFIVFIIVIVVGLQIMSRILPGNALPWTLEVAEMLLGALIWLTISVGIKTNGHVNFDLIIRRFSSKGRKFMVLLNNAIFMVYLIFMTVFTIQILDYYLLFGFKSTILGINMFWVRMPILIGCLMTLIRLAIKQYRIITDKEEVIMSDHINEGGV